MTAMLKAGGMRSGLMDSQFITHLTEGLRKGGSDGRGIALDDLLSADQAGQAGGRQAEGGESFEPGFGILTLFSGQVEDAADGDAQEGDLVLDAIAQGHIEIAGFKGREARGIKTMFEGIGITGLSAAMALFFGHVYISSLSEDRIGPGGRRVRFQHYGFPPRGWIAFPHAGQMGALLHSANLI